MLTLREDGAVYTHALTGYGEVSDVTRSVGAFGREGGR
jgi:hypothetical protein